MAVHAAWPPLATLAMFVIIVAFIIVKYGDRLLCARSVPLNHEKKEEGDQTSLITESCVYDEKDIVMEYIEVVDMPDVSPERPRKEKYEYAV